MYTYFGHIPSVYAWDSGVLFSWIFTWLTLSLSSYLIKYHILSEVFSCLKLCSFPLFLLSTPLFSLKRTTILYTYKYIFYIFPIQSKLHIGIEVFVVFAHLYNPRIYNSSWLVVGVHYIFVR